MVKVLDNIDCITAGDLKKRVFKKKYVDSFHVIGHISAVTADGKDSWYHIHSDEQVPVNVGISFCVQPDA